MSYSRPSLTILGSIAGETLATGSIVYVHACKGPGGQDGNLNNPNNQSNVDNSLCGG